MKHLSKMPLATLITCFLLSCTSIADSSDPNHVYTISENHAEGFYIGNIAEDTTVLQNMSTAVRATFEYSLQESSDRLYFSIDKFSGNLTTSNINIDREDICSFSTVCIKELVVYIKNDTYLASVKIQVNIKDENDNSPTFDVFNTKHISEFETVGTLTRLGTVQDRDLPGNNTIQSIVIKQSPTEVFELVQKSSSSDIISLELKLVQNVDREMQDEFTVTLIAKDGGNPALTGTHEVKIYINDENDNTPVFSKDEYSVTVNETVIVSSVILTVFATDADTGENARVSYSILERQPNVEEIKRLFAVDSVTGKITVKSSLTQEPQESYEFYVEASDHGEIPNTNSTLVKITVNDVENNSPVVQITLLAKSVEGNIAFIEENQPQDYVVAHVSAVDKDSGNNGEVFCNTSNSYFKLDNFQGQGFKISVVGVLDRETMTSHDVTVVCRDHGFPPQSASASFVVKVLDINDNDPVFEKRIYNATIKENNSIETRIATVKATDADFGDNGTIEYKLERSDSRLFINSTTGDIFANESLDREENDMIIFVVLAIDHGPTRRSASANVYLTVMDINDNPPFIKPTRPEFWVSENLPSNYFVGRLKAEDKDISSTNLTFQIAQISTNFPFIITADGEIRSTEVLNRELHFRYDIPVDVSDSELINTQYVTIYVTDVNDNSPIVTFPNADNDTVTFEYMVDIYNVVTAVAAYDTDYGVNGSLTYEIISGNEKGIFEINPHLGEVSVVKYIDIEDGTLINLVIQVKDKGQPEPRSTECTLKVILKLPPASNTAGLVDNGNQYVIISVVVIVTTVAVAVAIVAAILLLRRKDVKKSQEEACARYSDSGISSGSESQTTEGDGQKKKKEMSFPRSEYELAGYGEGRNVESTTDDYSRFYDAAHSSTVQLPPAYSVYQQEQMNALRLQQYLLTARDKERHQTHQNLEDSESETSRETNTCDSGRGGSVEDVSTSSPAINDDKSFVLEPRVPKRVTFHNHTYQYTKPYSSQTQHPVKQSTPVHHLPPRPPYRPSNSQESQIQQRLAIKTFPNHAQYHNVPSLNNSSVQNNLNKTPTRNSDYRSDMYNFKNGGLPLRMRHDSGSSFRSTDDDGGSSTSGSYTLEQNEIDRMDYFAKRADILV